jgi:hypothetical protein
MSWDKFLVIMPQVVVVIVLGACVIAGHDSYITDGLLAVSGSLTGLSLYRTVVKQEAPRE